MSSFGYTFFSLFTGIKTQLPVYLVYTAVKEKLYMSRKDVKLKHWYQLLHFHNKVFLYQIEDRVAVGS